MKSGGDQKLLLVQPAKSYTFIVMSSRPKWKKLYMCSNLQKKNASLISQEHEDFESFKSNPKMI